MSSAREHYDQRHVALSDELRAIGARYDVVAWARLVTLLGAVVPSLARIWVPFGPAGWALVGACALAFVVLVVVHGRLAERRQRAQAAYDHAKRAIDRLEGRWPSFPQNGKSFHQDAHPYALDLDLFGPGSLFQLLNDARTQLGEARIAGWLCEPADAATVRHRQEAVKELAHHHALREDLAVAGAGVAEASPDPEPFVAWASGARSFSPGQGLVAIMWLLPVLTVAMAAGSTRHPHLIWGFAIAFIASMTLVARLGPRLNPAINAASQRSGDLERFARILVVVESKAFQAEALKSLQQRLRASGVTASTEIARLARIVSTLEARENGAFRAVMGPILLWDLHCVAALERWQQRVGPHARNWLDALADFEACSSLATFAFEHPDYAWPDVDTQALHFEAVGLGHPLLDPQRLVVNDVSLPAPGFALLVTGSNMSGKSTLLRSIGAAAVLALAGAPVCARSLRMSVCAVRTSMRISDSVRDGVSRFYAEILKIKGVVDAAGGARPVLFLLDEILHGTNSRERHLGARSIIRALLRAGSIGAVSTHDLALADLSQLEQGKVRTVHFQEQVDGDKMSFDYRLREGLVRSVNALRWMRIVGLPVDDDAAAGRP